MEKEMTTLGMSDCIVLNPQHPGGAEKCMPCKISAKVKLEAATGYFQCLSSSSFSIYLPSLEVPSFSHNANTVMMEIFHICTIHAVAPSHL